MRSMGLLFDFTSVLFDLMSVEFGLTVFCTLLLLSLTGCLLNLQAGFPGEY